MRGLITVCARGGSKGVPGKNIKEVNNIPLIAYTINIAKEFSSINNCDIELSTDDDEIIRVAKQYGIKTSYLRPDHLANDSAGKGDAIKDVLLYSESKKNLKYDYILDLDVSSPLRTIEDLSEAFIIFKNNSNCLSLFSVNEASKNPYFNMVEQNKEGFFELCKDLGLIKSRQTAPKVYELNASFYFLRREYFDAEKLKVINDRCLIYQMPHICFDIDEPIDFDFFQYLVENNKLNFQI